jgi:hypothetical protein
MVQMAMQQAVRQTAQQGGPQIDMSAVPPLDVWAGHLQPTVAAVRRTSDGLEIVTYQTLPGGSFGASGPMAVAMLLPAVQASREAARRSTSMNNLKQIALAMLNHEAASGIFPAGYSADANGKPLLSWRVHVLPYLEEQQLYNEFHLDEPWDSEHNKSLIPRMPGLFRSPNSNAETGMTNYLGVGGADGVFVRPQPGDHRGIQLRNITDGTSKTIMVVEATDEKAVIWTRPADFSPDREDPTSGLTGMRVGGFLAVLADGSVQFFAESIDADILRGLFTKSGGEAAGNIDLQ